MKKIAANNRQLIKRAANKINKGKISKGLKTRGQSTLPKVGEYWLKGNTEGGTAYSVHKSIEYYSQERQHNFFLNKGPTRNFLSLMNKIFRDHSL